MEVVAGPHPGMAGLWPFDLLCPRVRLRLPAPHGSCAGFTAAGAQKKRSGGNQGVAHHLVLHMPSLAYQLCGRTGTPARD